MSVGGEYRFDRITVADLNAAGSRFGVNAGDAADLVDGIRRGVVTAFEQAVETVSAHGDDVRTVCDGLMRGLRMLPLVL